MILARPGVAWSSCLAVLANNDCQVNFPDLEIFISMYLGCCGLPADFNGDRRINLTDLSLMRAIFFGAPGPGAVNANCGP